MQTELQTDIMTIREVASYLKLKEKTAYRLRADYEQALPQFLECFFETNTMQRFLVGFARGTGL